MSAPQIKKFSDAKNPKFKWAVYFDAPGGGRKRNIFKTKEAANNFLIEEEVKAGNLGRQKAAALTVSLQDEAVTCQKRLTPFGKTLSDAVEHYILHLQATEKSAPISELVERFLEVQRAAKKSKYYLYELKNRLDTFADDHGKTYASEITTATLDQWIGARKVGDRTKNHFRRVLSAFFEWARIQKACPTNPARDAVRVKVATGRPEIYTPAQVRVMLTEAATLPEKSRDVFATVLLGLFAGLRPFEAQRLTWDQVLRRGTQWRIDLSAAGTKTGARRLVDVKEPLRAWLEKFFACDTARPIIQPNFPKRERAYRDTLKEKGIAWINDGLRHSFASYTLAGSNDAAATARALGHSDTAMLFAHYAEITTPEAAHEYFALTPEAILKNPKIIELREAIA